MSKFFFTNQKYNNKINVWYDQILIGHIDSIIKEKTDIDWQKYRADKTLKMSFKDRWNVDWRATTACRLTNIGTYSSKEEAAQAILDDHRKKYIEEYDGEED